jgi:uncharacterized protein involved in high-affinity Fe2+ transport
MQTTRATKPPMDPNTSEATAPQLDRAVAQGDAYRDAVGYLAEHVAQGGGQVLAGNYLVGYAVEDAEGFYEWQGDGELHWHNPGDANAHIEIAVADGADGRFIPELTITVSVVTPDGQELGPHLHPFMWHPMVYHYARDWQLPEGGDYTLQVHIQPPTFMRHDEVNGRRYLEPVDVVFENVEIKLGKEPVDPPE